MAVMPVSEGVLWSAAWGWPAEIFHGPARASGIAIFNSFGAAGETSHAHSPSSALSRYTVPRLTSQSPFSFTLMLAQTRVACFWHPGRVQAGLYLASGASETSGSWCCAGGIIGPYLIGALSDKYSYGAAMITLGAFNLLAALLFTTFPGEAATPRCTCILLTGQGKCAKGSACVQLLSATYRSAIWAPKAA